MQQTVGRRSGAGPAVLGLLLVAVGVVALIVRQLDVAFFEWMGEWGWPLYVIVPGLVLLGAALAPAPPKGLGFAVSGAVVTTIGGLLLYQAQSGHWESWAYTWALIPLAGGLGTLAYGLLTRTRTMITSGTWMAGIAAIMFVVGAWFFEGIFSGDMRFAELGTWWPVTLIAIGAVIVLASFLRPRLAPSAPPPAPTDSLTDEGPDPL
ncbi:MAG TPA: hypothetical protein VFV53_07040, partial [Candidatus Limnocylindrales bacterium]|nr:hypothetical protein [Candidatus Limnocylindrales bacterium]